MALSFEVLAVETVNLPENTPSSRLIAGKLRPNLDGHANVIIPNQPLLGGRAKAAGIHPKKLGEAVCRGLRRACVSRFEVEDPCANECHGLCGTHLQEI